MNVRRWTRLAATAFALAATTLMGSAAAAQAAPAPTAGPTLIIHEQSGARTVLRAQLPAGTAPEVAAAAAAWECELYNLVGPRLEQTPAWGPEVYVSASWRCPNVPASTGRLELTVGIEGRLKSVPGASWARQVDRSWRAPGPGPIGLGVTTEDTPCHEINLQDWRGVAHPVLIIFDDPDWVFDWGWIASPPATSLSCVDPPPPIGF